MNKNVLAIIKSILLIIVSILLLTNPSEAILMLASYIGAISMVFGAISIFNRYRMERKGIYSGRGYFEGILGILFGIILLAHPENLINILMIFFGIISIVLSLIQFSIFRGLSDMNIRSYMLLFSAIMSFILGMVLLFNPFESASIIAMIIGIFILVYGIISLTQSLGLNKKDN